LKSGLSSLLSQVSDHPSDADLSLGDRGVQKSRHGAPIFGRIEAPQKQLRIFRLRFASPRMAEIHLGFVAFPPFPQKEAERTGHGELWFLRWFVAFPRLRPPQRRGPCAEGPVQKNEPARMKFSSFLAEE
jgi:hypothetical protein